MVMRPDQATFWELLEANDWKDVPLSPQAASDPASLWKPVPEVAEPASKKSRIVEFEGKTHQFPADARDDEIREALTRDTKARRSKYGGIPVDDETPIEASAKTRRKPDVWEQAARDYKKGTDVWANAAKPNESGFRIRQAGWLTGILVLPPAVGYALLFLVFPWIVRGFRT